MPVILLTRPEEAAAGFARRLKAAFGPVQTLISPLTGVEWADVAPDISQFNELIFTSRNGVLAYQRLGPPAGLRAYCVGAATAKAANDAGLNAISADGDAGALIDLITGAPPGGPLLHLRGAETRGEIAERLFRSGIETHEAVIYRQITLPLSAQAKALLQGKTPVIVPLFSPRSAARFAVNAPFDAPIFLASISEAVAQNLHGLGAQAHVTASHPDAEAMLQAIAGLIDAATRLEAGGVAK